MRIALGMALCSLLMAGVTIAETKEIIMVEMVTSEGTMKLELYPEKAPVTVSNFLAYVDSGFYEGTIFHRVIQDFMIQGGGFDEDLNRKSTEDPIKNEAANGLRNERGTIAMARTQIPDSATSQFFINSSDNPALDYRNDSPQGIGYCVFGRVVEGEEVIDRIQSARTESRGGMQDVPQTTITIEKVTRLDDSAGDAEE